MNTFNIFAGVLLAFGVRDAINYFVDEYHHKKHQERLRAFLDHLEDEEADDDD
jgi:hypothetical protein